MKKKDKKPMTIEEFSIDDQNMIKIRQMTWKAHHEMLNNLVMVKDPKLGGYTAFFRERPDIIVEADNVEDAIAKLYDIYTVIKDK